MSHVQIVYVTYIDESCHTYEWVMSLIHIFRHSMRKLQRDCFHRHRCASTRHVTHTNGSCHPYEWAMSYMWKCNAMSENVIPPLALCQIRGCGLVLGLGLKSKTHTWMSHVPHMKASHNTHVTESCHTYKPITSHMCIHTYVMSHIRMSHVTLTNESCHTYEWVRSHIRMSHVTNKQT